MVKSVQAQNPGLAGEYYLRGVMETASGFQLNPDSSFQFFYSYGMLDRFGTGKWTIQDDQVVFNSRTRPPVDFRMFSSRSEPGDSITIVIKDNNELLLRYVHCQIRTKSGIKEIKTDEAGIAKFSKETVDSLALIFQLCPDRFSVFPADPKSNYYEFGFEPWIVEVFFDHFTLQYQASQLLGKHPLMQGSSFRYERAGKK
ncbi:MAG: hypothetical protein ACHQEM_08820 [Chitinophagales bacterium]